MGYQRRILSDSEATTLGSASSVLVAGVYSDRIDIQNYNDIDFFIKVTDKLSATQLNVTVEYSSILASSSEDWVSLNTEDITSGAAPQSPYSANFNLTSYSGVFTVGVTIPTRGRYMRIKLVPDSNISGVTFSAMRRV